MAANKIAILLMVFFTKNAIFHRAFVSDVYMDKKFYCLNAFKYSFIVKSQLQCIHLCLKKNCTFINYNMKENYKENCEILTEGGKCSTVVGQKNWMAMSMTMIMEVNFPHLDN